MEQHCECPMEMKSVGGWGRKSRGFLPPVMISVLGACIMLSVPPARAQLGNRAKLPGINKITSNGPTRQAFTGSVQSLDPKQHVLNVVAGENSAIFPIKKKVKVSSIEGAKLKLAALTPGTSIIVYYEQKGGHRMVDQIIILAPPAASSNKKSHPSS